MSDRKPSRSLAWSLGAFVGEIARAIRTPVDAADRERVEVERRTEQHVRDDGVVLRRTTIDEVELPPDRDPPPKG